MKDTFDEKMTASMPAQSVPAREAMFARVMEQVPGGMPVATRIVSPYTVWIQKPSKTFVIGVLGLFLVVGMGGTVAAAEAAKPGDLLFSLDQKTEAMRLFLATEERRAQLQSAFLDERQQELAAIMAEEIEKTKIEMEDNTNGVQVNEQGEVRITRAVDAFLRQAEQLPKSDTEGRRQAVMSLIEEIRVHGREGNDKRLRIDEDRFEIRTNDMRMRSRDDGEVEVRFADDNDDNSQRGEGGHYRDGNRTERQFDDSTGDTGNSSSGGDDRQDEEENQRSGSGNNDDAGDHYDDSDNRGEDPSGKDDRKDEDDNNDDNSGKSDDN